MRTAQVCPTCATYKNALCVLYVGEDLPNIGVYSGMSLEDAMIAINDALNQFTTTTTSSTTTTTTTAPVT